MAPLKQISSNKKIPTRTENIKSSKNNEVKKQVIPTKDIPRPIVKKESYNQISEEMKKQNYKKLNLDKDSSNTDTDSDNSSDDESVSTEHIDEEKSIKYDLSIIEEEKTNIILQPELDTKIYNVTNIPSKAEDLKFNTVSSEFSSEKLQCTETSEASKIIIESNITEPKILEVKQDKVQSVPKIQLSMSGNQSNNIKFSLRTKKYSFLSNFYDCEIIIDSRRYNHVEGYYQSRKFTGINENAVKHISNVLSPIVCKKIAYSYIMSEERKQEWNSGLKDKVMRQAVYTKFITNSELSKQLAETGDSILIENNPNDTYWAAGKDGKGENHLGKILMEIRQLIISGMFYN